MEKVRPVKRANPSPALLMDSDATPRLVAPRIEASPLLERLRGLKRVFLKIDPFLDGFHGKPNTNHLEDLVPPFYET